MSVMIDGIQFKVCGLTSLVDAEFSDRLGADYLGFILYPKSPRHVSLSQYADMAKRLPTLRKTVAVMVEPRTDELKAAEQAGFSCFQIHFRPELPLETVGDWSRLVGPDRLWLAPKLPPDRDVAAEWLPLAKTVLLDTFHEAGFGGSGMTGDWEKFARHQASHPGNRWVLAGGLRPENIGEALRRTRARRVDVNSGVEVSPGLKDHAKLKAFVLEIHRAATA